MLDTRSLTGILEQLLAELHAAEAEYAQIQHRVNSLRQAVGGIRGLLAAKATTADETPIGSLAASGTATPSAHGTIEVTGRSAGADTVQAPESRQFKEATVNPLQVSPTDHPRGVEAIRRVFEENEGTGWTIREMTAELDRRGWTPNSKNPVDAVRTAMLRAWRAPNSGIVREGSKFAFRPGNALSPTTANPSPNGAEPTRTEEVSDDQEVSGAVPTLTGGEHRS